MWDKVKRAMEIAAGVRAQGGWPVRLLPEDVAEAERLMGRPLRDDEEDELQGWMLETAAKERGNR